MYAGDLQSKDAWALLAAEDTAALIDVRTRAEWTFVGIVDLSDVGRTPVLVEWQSFPDMAVDPAFADKVEAALGKSESDRPLLFLCRSGARSRAAAVTMSERGFARCYNISDGFEGPANHQRHRGNVAGWKAEGLPWMQG